MRESNDEIFFLFIILNIKLLFINHIITKEFLMISAKLMAFRQEIRRRQINEKFRQRRRQIIEQSKAIKQKAQFINQVQSITSNIEANMAERDYYNIYQCLMDLKKVIVNTQFALIKLILHQDFKVIQTIANALKFVGLSELQDHNKLPIFQNASIVLSYLMGFEEVSNNRIIQSGIIQISIPYLQLSIQKQAVLENIFKFFANAVRQSQQVACLYTRLGIPQLLIQLIHKNNPKVFNHALWEFLFFLRSYFEEERSTIIFTPQQVQVCVVASQQVINYLMLECIQQQTSTNALEDSLKVTKQLITLKMVTYDDPAINYQRILDIIYIKHYSIQVKKQALFIIDTIIYEDAQNQLTRKLVVDQKMLHKIFGVDEEILYIALNIFANVALDTELKKQLTSFVPRIKLLLCLTPECKQIYILILNYFSSQKFQVESFNEKALINQLWSRGCENRPDILKIEAKIWLGLCSSGYNQRPPLRILQAKEIAQVQDIMYCLEHSEKLGGSNNVGYNQDQMQSN